MKKLVLHADDLDVVGFPTTPAESDAALAITEPGIFTPTCPITGAGSCWCTAYDTCNCP